MTGTYRYRAADATGRVVEGDLQSRSRSEAIDYLRRQSLYPVEVSEAQAQTRASNISRASTGDSVAVWTRTLSAMLSAGLPLERSLTFSSTETSNKELTSAVLQIRDSIRGGSTLASAMRGFPKLFSPLYLAMVRAGEESGALDKVLARLSDSLDEAAELKARVRSALLYPALMGIVAALGVTTILLFVIPRFIDMLGEVGGHLPVSTRALIAASAFITGYWWLWLPVIAVVVWSVRRWLSRPENRKNWHRLRLDLPIAGDVERNYITARFARTVGLLQQSGIAIMPTLRIARSAVTNEFIGDKLDRAIEGVGQGRRLGTEMVGILPPLAVQLFSAGEETARLGELCLKAADTYDRDVSRKLRTATALLEPALIVVFGAIVGFVALAMLQAIYSVNANVL